MKIVRSKNAHVQHNIVILSPRPRSSHVTNNNIPMIRMYNTYLSHARGRNRKQYEYIMIKMFIFVRITY